MLRRFILCVFLLILGCSTTQQGKSASNDAQCLSSCSNGTTYEVTYGYGHYTGGISSCDCYSCAQQQQSSCVFDAIKTAGCYHTATYKDPTGWQNRSIACMQQMNPPPSEGCQYAYINYSANTPTNYCSP